MEFRELGKTGLKVSRLAFGCTPMGGYDYGTVRDEDSASSVHAALDLGVNFFDTADIYGLGHAEEVLGRSLGNRRGGVVIATKFGLRWDQSGRVIRDSRPERVSEALDGSLRRLKVDTIDLYQIHWPDPDTPLEDTIEALCACQEAGKIRHIGCSNFSGEIIDEAQKRARIESVQASCSLMDHLTLQSLRFPCLNHGMSFIAHTTLARGFLTGKYQPGHLFVGTDTRNRSPNFSEEKAMEKLRFLRTVEGIAAKHGKSCSQIAIRWVLDNAEVCSAIVGIKNTGQLKDNCAALDWALPRDEFALLANESRSVSVAQMKTSWPK